jgi:hypothetical protein
LYPREVERPLHAVASMTMGVPAGVGRVL